MDAVEKRYAKVIGCSGIAIIYLELLILPAMQPHREEGRCRIIADPNFTPEQLAVIRQAGHRWEQAVGHRWLRIEVEVGRCPLYSDRAEACIFPAYSPIICTHPNPTDIGCTIWRGNDKPLLVQVDVKFGTINTFSHVIQHEIGHILRLRDSSAEGEVMLWYTDEEDQQPHGSQNVSPIDARNYIGKETTCSSTITR